MIDYLSDLESLLAEGTAEERRTVLKGFVTETIKGDDEATLCFTLPFPPTQEELEAVGGAEGPKDRTFEDRFHLDSRRRRSPAHPR